MAELVLDDSLFESMVTLVDKSYVAQARQVGVARSSRVKQLIKVPKLPEGRGWCEDEIVAFVNVLSSMDSNNFCANVGVGEREARVASPLVRRLHHGMAHGIGRSGDVSAVQPKAAGSSLLSKLANLLALDALRLAGLKEMRSALVVPCATGLTLALCLLSLSRGACDERKTVIWLRIDQKSCLKGIALAGMRIVVVEPTRSRKTGSAPRARSEQRRPRRQNDDQAADAREEGDDEGETLGEELLTDTAALEAAIREVGPESLLCVVSTSSCFAPRCPDDIEAVARLCSSFGVAHLVNNAYGVQCSQTCANISRAQRVGRVDLVIQSTDKNFLVPVGGCVVAGGSPELVENVAKAYPGRASATPSRDLLITLLGLGKAGWLTMLKDRETLFPEFQSKLRAVATKHGERLVDVRHNKISVAVSLETLDDDDPETATKLGSMLFTRCCSGTRVVAPNTGGTKTVAGIDFVGFGSNITGYPFAYLTAACAIGVTADEIDQFVARLDKTLAQLKRKQKKANSK